MPDTELLREIVRIIEPWHNYKRVMRYDTKTRIRPDGEVVPVVDVGKFQEIINGCSGRLLAALDVTDVELVNSLLEVIANAKTILDAEQTRGTAIQLQAKKSPPPSAYGPRR